MTKTRKSVRIKAIKDCLGKNRIVYKVARKYGIAGHTLAVLVSITKKYGLHKALHLCKHWDNKDRSKVVKRKMNHHATYSQTAIKFGIRSVSSVYDWKLVYEYYGRMGLKHYHQGQPHKYKRFEKLGIKAKQARAIARERSSQVKINYLKKLAASRR